MVNKGSLLLLLCLALTGCAEDDSIPRIQCNVHEVDGLPESGKITAVQVTQKHQVIACAEKGLLKYDGHHWSIIALKDKANAIATKILGRDSMEAPTSAVGADDGSIWVASLRGLWHQGGDSFDKVTSGVFGPRSLFLGNGGEIWGVEAGQQLVRIDGDVATVVLRPSKEYNDLFRSAGLSRVLADKSGRVWVGGHYKKDVGKETSSEGLLWLSDPVAAALYVFDGKRWSAVLPPSVPFSWALPRHADKELVWFRTDKGWYSWDGQNWSREFRGSIFGAADDASSECFFGDGGRRWVLCDSKLFYKIGKDVCVLNDVADKPKVRFDDIKDLAEDTERSCLWVVVDSKLYRIVGKDKPLIPPTPSPSSKATAR
jgi:hypothetical protein